MTFSAVFARLAGAVVVVVCAMPGMALASHFTCPQGGEVYWQDDPNDPSWSLFYITSYRPELAACLGKIGRQETWEDWAALNESCETAEITTSCSYNSTNHSTGPCYWSDSSHSGSALGAAFCAYCPAGQRWNGTGCVLGEADPSNLGECTSCGGTGVGNPINAATGNKYQKEVDYRSAGPYPLTFERSYNSFGGASTARLGPNWRSNYDRKLLIKPFGTYGDRPFFTISDVRIRAIRPDGRELKFTATASSLPAGTKLGGPPYARETLEKTSSGYRLRDASDWMEDYDNDGRLLSISHPNGFTQQLTYDAGGKLERVTDSFGRSLIFTYNAQGKLSMLTVPVGLRVQETVYTYDAGGRLATVNYPGGVEYKTYVYENASFPNLLTGILDRSGRFATFSYDSLGRGYTSEHAGGAGKVTVTYNSDGSASVLDSLGTSRAHRFNDSNGYLQSADISCTSCGAGSRTYDANGFPASKTDPNGNVTTYVFNTRGLEQSRTEAYGTSLARTITTQWHPAFRLPTQIDEPGRRTVFTYDSDTGNRLTETITDLSTGENRKTTWTYTTFGRVQTIDGARTDVSDITTYTYYTCTTGGWCGQVNTITNAAGHVTTITGYDSHGNPTDIVDPNGTATALSYDWNQRLRVRAIAGAKTTLDYDVAGRLDKITHPDGSFLAYDYDAAHRLTDITDNLGNRIHYTLDSLGNRTAEEVFDPAGVFRRKHARIFDELGRLDLVKNAAGTVVTDHGYDAQGNRTSQRDFSTPSISHLTEFVPDALNRIEKVIDPVNGVTAPTVYGFDALDQLISVKDPKGLTTRYTINALGDIKQLTSPDTGVTIYTYDAAGNRKTQLDARGVSVSYTYDPLNRLTIVDYPGSAEDVTYTYDGTNYTASEPYGKGRLTKIVDESGTTTLFYDARGNVTEERRSIAGTTYVTSYTYDAADRLKTIGYPTGRLVTYVRNVMGQVTQVTTTLNGVTSMVADNVTYMPFGDVKGYTLGNGVSVTRKHGLDGYVEEIGGQGTALVQDTNLYYDLRGNLEATEDLLAPSSSQTFVYDPLSRLQSADGLYGSRSYTYDGVGDRLTEGTEVYTYPATSHRLSSVGAASYSHDAAGNITAKGSLGLAYNAAGRAATVGSVANVYDASGKRVTKIATGTSTVFHYDRQGHLLGEKVTQGAGAPGYRDYVWLGDLPLSLDGMSEYPSTIVDNTDPGFGSTGSWTTSTATGGHYGANYHVHAAGVSGTQIMDNGAPGTSWEPGNWQFQTSLPGFYGANYQRIGQGGATYNWTLSLAAPGDYRVYARWVTDPNARININYNVTFDGGTKNYPVNHRAGGGVWNLLGTHPFTTIATIQEWAGGGGGSNVNADAVRLVPASTEIARWSAPSTLTFEVLARWPASATHSPQANYRIVHAGGTTDVLVNQQAGGGTWTSLGTYTFSNTTSQAVTLLADPDWAVAADAMLFKPVANQFTTTRSYYHVDQLGTPLKLTDASQQVVWEASYEPFGEVTLLTGGVTQPLRFPGQYFDAETGLHQNWHRDYDPSIGRYLQSDPIGLDGGLNTYGYASANPIMRTDPQGLFDGLGAMYPVVPPDNAEGPDSAELSEAQTEGVAMAGAAIGAAAPALVCARVPACRAWAEKAKEQCKNLRCKLEIHTAHHPFGPPFNKRLPHVQLTCWIKGQKGSERKFHIPLPEFMDPKKP